MKKAEAPDHQLFEQLHGFEPGSGETCEARDFGSYPESFSLLAGLLALPVICQPSHPGTSGQWLLLAKPPCGYRITAAGTAPDLNRIPSSFRANGNQQHGCNDKKKKPGKTYSKS